MKVWHLMQLAPADKGPKSTLSTIASIFHEQCLCQLSSRDYWLKSWLWCHLGWALRTDHGGNGIKMWRQRLLHMLLIKTHQRMNPSNQDGTLFRFLHLQRQNSSGTCFFVLTSSTTLEEEWKDRPVCRHFGSLLIVSFFIVGVRAVCVLVDDLWCRNLLLPGANSVFNLSAIMMIIDWCRKQLHGASS